MTAGQRGLLRDAIVVIGVSLVTFGLHHVGLLDRFETAGLDAFNVLRPARDSTDLVVIGIQEQDYAKPTLFNGTSPLDCKAVRRIIDAIAAGHPTVIGIDLDTSSGDFACLGAPAGRNASWPPIVWAQDAIWNPETREFSPQPVLRGALTPPGPPHATGIAVWNLVCVFALLTWFVGRYQAPGAALALLAGEGLNSVIQLVVVARLVAWHEREARGAA